MVRMVRSALKLSGLALRASTLSSSRRLVFSARPVTALSSSPVQGFGLDLRPVALSSSSFSSWNGDDEDYDDDLVEGEFVNLDNADDRLDAETHQEMLRQYHMAAPMLSQTVFVVQPYVRRWYGRERKVEKEGHQFLPETLALVDTLGWKVADSAVVGLPSMAKPEFFGSGTLELLKERVNSFPHVTVVFVSTYRLRPSQRASLEDLFEGIAVVDRYSLVLQIFQRHARTREARLQVSLAEIPYLKQRLHGDRYLENRIKHSKSRRGDDFFERRAMALKRQEARIRRKIDAFRESRRRLRKARTKMGIPSVAVVGYTNCGKTSVIRALTGSDALRPRNQLFATLDVTVHEGVLPATGLKALFVDTVGFISDIPTELVASFSATLEDAALADLIIHVRDASHPDTETQCQNVLETLVGLGVPQESVDGMVTIANKMDLLPPDSWPGLKSAGMLPVSATRGFGVPELARETERRLLRLTGRRGVRVRCRTGSEEMDWLRRNSTVTDSRPDPQNANYSLLSVVATEAEMGRFKKRFSLAP